MYKKLHYRSLITLLLPLCALLSSIGCQESSEPSITKINEALEPIDVPIQTAQFQLVEEESGRVLADGFSLEAIAQAASPIVNGEVVQATDVMFSGDMLLVSYNFKGDPHLGALQVIDVSKPDTPTLEYEIQTTDADLNRIQMYQNRYLLVASGTADESASLKIFDLQGQPVEIATLDLPSKQATMVALYQDYALVTTGDNGGVIGISLQTPSAPEIAFSYPLADARYIEVLPDDEFLLVSGGVNASLIRLSWSQLNDQANSDSDDVNMFVGGEVGIQTLSLSGLSVGAPSWGFRSGDRFHLSADEQGLLTFSLANGSLEETGTVPTEGDANAGFVESEGRFALLANGQEGLVVLNTIEGQETELLAQFDTPGDRGSANAIAMKGSLVALADGLGGIKLLEAHLLRNDHEIPSPPSCGGTVFEGTFRPTNNNQLVQFCNDGYSIISEDLIVNQTGMVSLAGLECLCEVRRHMQISRNATLMRLNGLDNLRLIGEDMKVNNNNSLRNFDALGSLSWIGNNLRVHDESSLANMNGLSGLEAIGNNLSLQGNRTLSQVGTLGQLVWIGNDFLIKNNSSLSSLSGMNNLPHLTSQFEITGNRTLRSIAGLTGLEEVEGNVLLNQNASLQSVNGLTGLRNMQNLSINGNRTLRNFNGLLNIEVVDGDFSVRNNASLPNARAIELRDQIGAGITGNISISGNSP